MTQEELEALPIDGEISYTEEVRDGVMVRVPHLHTVGALYQGPTDGMVKDQHGTWWMIGWAGGKQYRRRMRKWPL